MHRDHQLNKLREAVRAAALADEAHRVNNLLATDRLRPDSRKLIVDRARELVLRCREKTHKSGTLDAFLQEFGLSNPEGVALMCVAEALLRIPDAQTADRLIAEKIQAGNWDTHRGHSRSRFVNASVWGLMLTGRFVALESEIVEDTNAWFKRLVARLGEPVLRSAMLQAMRIIGEQYVMGRTIEDALHRTRLDKKSSDYFSFDMLGEGSRTEADSVRRFAGYQQAIEAIGARVQSNVSHRTQGISVKLSALHPRYEYSQRARVLPELGSRVVELARLAQRHGVGMTLDAEESTRLELNMELFEQVLRDPSLAGWHGFGFVVQAYLKRAPELTQWLIELGRACDTQFTVRLVKGAYWDGEIKRAQELGLEDYPVFTRKAHTDLCYEVCAQLLLDAPDVIYPQFASHNAQTLAGLEFLTAEKQNYEYQRLHGMGELLFDEFTASSTGNKALVRVYAPVGNHEELLPYLVRRLLENGANSSFVNRFLDARILVNDLIQDTRVRIEIDGAHRHDQISHPRELPRCSGENRSSAKGMDLTDPITLTELSPAIRASARRKRSAGPLIRGNLHFNRPGTPVVNPARISETLGEVRESLAGEINEALSAALSAQQGWDSLGGGARADCLLRAADLLQARSADLIGLIVAEGGRTIPDALSEVREAIDFCLYYAERGRQLFGRPAELPGPTGEVNQLSLHGRGVFACISPWNFPLAIFLGQVTAALVAGNSVIAKPAEQTPLTALEASQILHQAGIPVDVLHLLPGGGAKVGAALTADPRIAGIAFTGSTETAHLINAALSRRTGPITPLIAETGGLNAMIADSTALPEQLVDDIITSAFKSAGQRCSCLRVLYLQDDVATSIIDMLRGAMRELRIGDPAELETDIGPIIDESARSALFSHCEHMDKNAELLATCRLEAHHRDGWFFAPRVYEIRSIHELSGEVFGPILHVIRYRGNELEQVIDDINATGYGLTLGVHSRIDAVAQGIFSKTRIGNTYVNRSMIGAVVGTNPFGGQGLSGTGPKAGGPHYLLRFATEKTYTENTVAKGGNTTLFQLEG